MMKKDLIDILAAAGVTKGLSLSQFKSEAPIYSIPIDSFLWNKVDIPKLLELTLTDDTFYYFGKSWKIFEVVVTRFSLEIRMMEELD